MPDAIRGNFITNRPDILTAPIHLAKHLGQSVWQGLKSLCGARPSHAVAPGIRPRGREPVAGDPALPNLRGARPIHLSSHESFRDLPMVTPEQAKQAHKYILCSHLSSRLDDAFQCTHQDRELVPGSIRSSTVRQEGQPTQLIDSSTGLAASIHFDPASREVIVGFSGISFAGSRFGCGLNQMLSCAAQWLGLVPKNMRQGSRIVELMKEHIDALNRELPEDQKLELTVTGFSMGGGVASYAALRNEVPAVVFNPMRLGLGARARVGQNMLAQADRYLTEVVIPGDWVSDNGLSHLYKLNPLTWGGVILDSTGKLGNARRLLLPPDPGIQRRHTSVYPSLARLIRGAEQRDFLLPGTSRHWDATYTDEERARLTTEPLGELASKMRAEYPGHSEQIDALVQTLSGIELPSQFSDLLNGCRTVAAACTQMQAGFAHLRDIAQARELLAQLPPTALREALGEDLQQLQRTVSNRIVALHGKVLQLSAEALERFAVDRQRREAAEPDRSPSYLLRPHSELMELDAKLAYLVMANNALKDLDSRVVDGVADQMDRGAAMIDALQSGVHESASHLISMIARNARPESFAQDLDLCEDAKGAEQLTARALGQARAIFRLRTDLDRQFAQSPIRSQVDDALGRLQGEWLARAVRSADKGIAHAEMLMDELDACFEQLSEQPADLALRSKLERISQQLRDSIGPLNAALQALQLV